MIAQTRNVKETLALAAELVSRLPLPAVLAISGQLGAGKTHFIKGLGMGLGIDPRKVCSATFVIIAEYGNEKRLIHIDAYRLEDPEELQAIGWDELLEQSDSVIAVEWADKIQPLLPEDRLDIQIDMIDDHNRLFTFTPHGQRYIAAIENIQPSLPRETTRSDG